MFFKKILSLFFCSSIFMQSCFAEGDDLKQKRLQIEFEQLACDYISKHSEEILRKKLDELSDKWDVKNYTNGFRPFNYVKRKYVKKDIGSSTCVCREWALKIYDILKRESIESYLICLTSGKNVNKKHLVTLCKLNEKWLVIDFRLFTSMLAIKNDINKNKYLYYNLWNEDGEKIALKEYHYYDNLKSVNDTLFLPLNIFLKSMRECMNSPKVYYLIFPDTMSEKSEWPYGEIGINSIEIISPPSDDISIVENKIMSAIGDFHKNKKI